MLVIATTEDLKMRSLSVEKPTVGPYQKNITRQFEVNGKRVAVYDDCFSKEEINSIYCFLKKQSYHWAGSDSPENNWSIRWKAEFPENVFNSSPFAEISKI